MDLMRIGTFLPTYWMDYGAAGRRTAIEETAKAAQALGYESLWANDHIVAPASQESVGHIIEPLITLASLIHLVPDMRLGTSTLVLPQRNAILVAKQVAALDVLSGGRFILGVGSGWLAEEFAFLGADFAQRGAVMDEAIGVMRALWRDSMAGSTILPMR
jgi:alkanesulfonate monooxygenase SsuD/methylene tetrahydromethanopterin reductase-like flavin-dependent oxidoreductase (luciferase family)